MNPIAEFVKENRKKAGLTQEQFALRCFQLSCGQFRYAFEEFFHD